MMSNDSDDQPGDWPSLISALVDGEADGDACARALLASEQADGVLDRWHAYHLIGDVLRSEELAAEPAHDRRFLHAVHARLAAGPSVAAPVVPAHAAPRLRWALPLALAAGVAVLASALVALRLHSGDDGAAPALASAGTAVQRAAASAVLAAAPETDGARSAVLRDAQLDRYLRAHREYGAAHAVSLPGGPGRGLETVSFER